jgi:hypothetical protein
VVATRNIHNDRLIDALTFKASRAIVASPGARAYYDKQRERGVGYNAALRRVGNRLVGILHSCLKIGALNAEAATWTNHIEPLAP